MMDANELRDAIIQAQAGDADGFEALLTAYKSRLYGFFLRATGKHHDTEDLLGEMILRLVRTLKNYDHKGRFEPWLFRIAANLVRDRFRRSKTRPEAISLSIGNENGRSLAGEIADVNPAVDRGVLAEETSKALQEALAKLDETTREMVLLRYFGELSFKEIAREFDCPLGTALARVHRGLKTLRRGLENELNYARRNE